MIQHPHVYKPSFHSQSTEPEPTEPEPTGPQHSDSGEDSEAESESAELLQMLEETDREYEAYMAAAGDEREQMRSVLDAYKAEQSRRKGSSKGGRQRR